MKYSNIKSLLTKYVNKLWENVEYSEIINSFIMDYPYLIIDYTKPTKLNELKKLFKECYEEDFKYELIELNETKYLNNEYIKNIKPLEFKNRNYKLSYKSFDSYQPILINDLELDEYGNEIINIGYFSNIEEYKYLSIERNNNIWMEITPHEINTMEDSINKASGEVVVYGLGLGYYAYMVSNKDNVSKVTIIEKDQNIIDIFNQYIFPFFKYKDKIHIINMDALKYDIPISTNYVFIDLWHDANDGLPLYLELIKKEKLDIQYSYWLENSLIQLIRRYIICIISNELIDHDYNYKLISKLLNNIKIESKLDFEYLISDEGIKQLIKK